MITPESQKGKYFVLAPSYWSDGIGPGLVIANEEKLVRPGMYTMDPPNGDPSQYSERPHLIHVPEEGGLPREFEELAGIWIISEPLKRVFESVDPEAFVFTACDYTQADGSPGRQYHLCDVVRRLDALDVGASRVKTKYDRNFITGEDETFYSVLGGASLVFREASVGGAHVFRQTQMSIDPVCDRVLYDALCAANLDGVELRDAAEL
ncbi:imm11 family protein [Achromobacter sp.]|uniref:imm11 family protein n=1 Tax=Achromobacter sp. TaxID=134375 RepID=UPI0028ABD14D|nr:DUF1629 domain-containing protein [Achromobacter sp.]